LLAEWKSEDIRNLSRLLRKIADDAMEWVKTL
jgi:hypothetical protein